jgi:hypothetical protein
MHYLLSGGEVVAGLGVLVLWWLALSFLGRRWGGQPMGAIRFAVIPCIFLLWLVSGSILVLRGFGLI